MRGLCDGHHTRSPIESRNSDKGSRKNDKKIRKTLAVIPQHVTAHSLSESKKLRNLRPKNIPARGLRSSGSFPKSSVGKSANVCYFTDCQDDAARKSGAVVTR
jgi:hypothetical protein